MRIPYPTQIARAGATALMLAILGSAPIGYAEPYQFPEVKNQEPTSEELKQLEALSRATATLAANSKRALVFISVAKAAKGQPMMPFDPFDFFFGPHGFDPRQLPGGRGGPREPREAPRQEGLGSGFIVDLDKGYIITNNHVIDGADEIQLKLANGDMRTGKVIGGDDKTDVAVVQISQNDFNRKDLAALRLGNSESLAVGEFVVALGAPFGLEASLSQGVVSATGRGNLDITQIGDFIQTDAAINPGNSGGPLLNARGEVVGMNTAIFSRSGAYNGIGFAVPANIVRTVASELINSGRVDRGYLGISLQEVGPEIIQGLKLPEGTQGALVAQVQPNSPAAKAGFEAGDVIIRVNDRAIRSGSQIVNTVGLMKPGSTLSFTILRDGDERKLQAKISNWPQDQRLASSGERESQGGASSDYSAFGLAVTALTEQERAQYGLESKQGVLITSVEPNSSAARVGLQEGDLIVAVNNKPAPDLKTFSRLQGDSKRLLLRIERRGDFFFVPLKRS